TRVRGGLSKCDDPVADGERHPRLERVLTRAGRGLGGVVVGGCRGLVLWIFDDLGSVAIGVGAQPAGDGSQDGQRTGRRGENLTRSVSPVWIGPSTTW